MKIGILTLNRYTTNYGGILQAYALQTTLQRQGHEVAVINILNKDSSIKCLFKSIKRHIKKYILSDKSTVILTEQAEKEEGQIVAQYTKQFMSKYINFLEMDTYKLLQKNCFDAIVVGSDQVWRPRYFGEDNIEDAYLRFAKEWDIKRIAYAASFGTEEWEYTPKQTVACGSLIKAFDKVAVREFSAIDLCKIYFDITAECVVDPTMLLEMTDYIELIRKYIPISDSDNNSHNHRGNLTVYMLDGSDDKNKVVDQVAITMNLTQCQINKNKDRNIDVHERVQPSIESWLYAFYNADFVVTDSFHGCVFSIIFNKPFIVYGNKDRGLARFSSLLSMFNLQNRYISSFDELKSDLYDDINWQEVNTVLKEQRQRSQQFLSELLN